MYILLLRCLFCVFAVAEVSPGAVTLELKKVTGKTKAELELVVGASSGVDLYHEPGQACPCERVLYLEGKLAVVFIEGKSDWLWVYEGVRLSGIKEARIKALFRFGSYTLIKTTALDNTICCATGV